MTHQAVPGDADWWAGVFADDETREWLPFIPSFLQGMERRFPLPHFYAVVDALARDYPGIATRQVDLYRRWDSLHFVLSGARRAGKRENDLGSDAVLGAQPVCWKHKPVAATQGIGVRYTPADRVFEVAAFLDVFTPDLFRAQYDVNAMAAAHIYKFGTAGASGADFDVDLDCFLRLQQFYRDMAFCNEGVLVVLD